MRNRELTNQQLIFINEYLRNGCNGTQAALKAKYKKAAEAASYLLRIPKIRAYIEEQNKKLEKKTEVTRERVVQALANIAFADIGLIAKWENNKLTLKKSEELTPTERRMINEVVVNPGQFGISKKVKLKDSVKCLEILAKYLGMLDGHGADKEDHSDATERLSNALKQLGFDKGPGQGSDSGNTVL